ncbi:hypothetical protein GCM10018952_03330 [Streptosporangium vulgare]
MATPGRDEGELVIEGEFVMGAKPGNTSGSQVTRARFLARALQFPRGRHRFGPRDGEQVIVTAAVPYEGAGAWTRDGDPGSARRAWLAHPRQRTRAGGGRGDLGSG